MPRTYSKNGCNRCKLRKKKCTEERPRCATCVKWKWTCEYDQPPSSRDATVRSARCLPTNGPLPLDVMGRRGPGYTDIESRVLQLVPERIRQFFSPISNEELADLQTMFQLMTTNELLRHSIVACFSAGSQSEALAKLNRVAYGRALQSLRSRVLQDSLDEEERICVVTSITFLGKMESFDKNSLADPLEHWVALIPLLGSKEMLEMIERGIIPLNETMLILESLLYHVATEAIFSHNVDRTWHLWRTHRIYERICKLNPEGPNRINLSPLLAGQYELYDLALHVTYLSQCHPDRYISSDLADELEAKVRRCDVRLDAEFNTNMKCAGNYANYKVERIVYHAFCNSLLIIITSLREPSRDQRIKLHHLNNWGTKLFLWRPSALEVPITLQHASHLTLAAIWPTQILICSAHDLAQLDFLLVHFAEAENYLDPGHIKRSHALFAELSGLLIRSRSNELEGDADAPPVPPGLTLLRQGFDALKLAGFESRKLNGSGANGPQ